MISRAERRNQERQERNAVARSVVVDDARPVRAGTKTQLDILFGRGAITAEQRIAGERLYKDFHLSGAEPRMTATFEPSLGGRSSGIMERQADAYDRYQAAMKAVGQILSPVLVHVVLLDGSAGEWAILNRMPKTHGAPRLVVALEYLVDHYKS